MKRILTIQDISCIGKCSLGVALPVISSFGIECAVMPTAILSNHTAFPHFTFKDLTDEIIDISETWNKLNISFDGIYSGYIGSEKQLDIVNNLFKNFKTKDNFIIIDPVLGDNGKLYSGFDNSFSDKMKKLIKNADILVPNMTEASYLLDIPYKNQGYDEDYIKDILKKLSDTGANLVILTGISFSDDRIGVYCYNKKTNKYFYYFDKKYNSTFHGTGDVFASCLCGALVKGFSIEKSIEISVKFTAKSIYNTITDKNSQWYGVNYESALPYIIEKIK